MSNKNYSWVRYIHQRIKNNKNFIVTITGPTGSGKSWAGLSIGELVDEEFNIDRIVFSAVELMKLINSGELKSGSVILWDEAGIDLSNRNWQSMTNKLINFLVQTFRHKNFILIFTVPYTDFVDTATKKMFHADFQTVSINKHKKTCRIKPKLLQYNSNLKKWYFKYLKSVNGKVTKIRRWDIPKPSEDLIKKYEKKKTDFTNSLNDEIELSLEVMNKDSKVQKPLTDFQNKILEFWKKGITKQIEIAKHLGTRQNKLSDNYKYMRNKGYFVEKYYDNQPNTTIQSNPT